MAKSQIKLAMKFLRKQRLSRKEIKHSTETYFIEETDVIHVLEMLRTGEFKEFNDSLNAVKIDKPK